MDQPGQMEWSQFLIKTLGDHFGNTILNNSHQDKISESIIKKSITIWKRVRPSLRGKKIIVNQILMSKLWYIGQVCTIPKHVKKEIEVIYDLLWIERKKYDFPGSQLNSPFGGDGLGFFDIYIELNQLKIKWSQSLLNPTNALWKDLILYRLDSVLNSNQGLLLFRQNRFLGLTDSKICKNRTMKISLPSYLMLGYISLRSIEEILD